METKDLTEQLKKTIKAYCEWQVYKGCGDGSDDMAYMDYRDEKEVLEKELSGKIWHLHDNNIGVIYTSKNFNDVMEKFIAQVPNEVYGEKLILSVEV